MPDKEYWKKIYQSSWPGGNTREQIAVNLFADIGINLKPYGFETLSNEYNKDSPKEPGSPDFQAKIKGQDVFFEVTGTDVDGVGPKADLWVRPDKAKYAEKHKMTWFCIHILNNKYNLIRFVNLKNVLDARTIEVRPKGVLEKYQSVSPEKSISIEDFKTLIGI